MSINRIAYAVYVVFLLGYSWYKYQVAAPEAFSIGYFQSVAILVVMTGIAPFLLALIGVRISGMRGLPAIGLGLGAGLIVCMGGYAGYFTLFIAGNVPDVTLTEVALRGVGWGLLQGALAALAARR